MHSLSKEFETAAAKSWGLFSFPEFRHLLRTADAARFVPHRGENGDFEKGVYLEFMKPTMLKTAFTVVLAGLSSYFVC